METTLRHENQRLSKELEDAQLDLDDARRSRREMQQQLNVTNQRLGQFNMDNENLKVFSCTLNLSQHFINNHRIATPT
jgi:hypothetical protein